MTPIDSFSHLLNGIFSEFQADSTIVISYRLLTNDNAGHEKQIPRLTCVNGFSNSDAYRDYLQRAKARMLSMVEDCLAGLDDRSRQGRFQVSGQFQVMKLAGNNDDFFAGNHINKPMFR